ncbi:hypothetical protein ACE01N_08605 [Saccharicrinis sp. FJH2]|uniref:hypothetical protein n=1 Tax=Saccharicrinis sp. FJH65 TaxID=3344659 RepID=UPI0035F49F83
MNKIFIRNAFILERSLIFGTIINFEIERFEEKNEFLIDETICYSFQIKFTGWVFRKWDISQDISDEDLIKLAFPYVVKEVSKRLNEDGLKDAEMVKIEYNSVGEEYPYDLSKIKQIIGYEFLVEEQKQEKFDLIDYLMQAAFQLQGNHKIILNTEDSRNSFISNILTNKGVISKDQSRWGKSESGKKQGELDIKIEDENGLTLSVFEGMNLKSLDKGKIESHISKIFNYDPNGLKNNFLFVYSDSNSFSILFKKYYEYLNELLISGYNFNIVKDVSNEYSKGAEIKVLRTGYERQNITCNLYHVLINLNL